MTIERYRSMSCTLVLAVGITATAVRAQQEIPSWVSNPREKYPDADYLVAIGSGDTRRDAEETAASNLSMIFESAIKAENTLVERYKELSSAAGESLEKQSESGKAVTISSDQTLYNIQYGESYTDGKGTTFVAAYLERLPTAEIYRTKIGTNAGEIRYFIDRSGSSPTVPLKYACLNAAAVIGRINKSLRDQLVIILPGENEKLSLGYDDNELMSAWAAMTKNVVFSVAMEGDAEGKVAAFVRKCLSAEGFVVGRNPVLSLKGETSIENVQLQSPQKFVRWSYMIQLSDATGETLATLAENGREGHVTLGEARARAYRAMGEKIGVSLPRELARYFDGLVKKQ